MHFLKFTIQIYVKIMMSIEICKRIILHLRNYSAHFCIKIKLHFFLHFRIPLIICLKRQNCYLA